MRWCKKTSRSLYGKHLEWHSWFAWYRVTIENGCKVWGEFVWRKGHWGREGFDTIWIWEYQRKREQ